LFPIQQMYDMLKKNEDYCKISKEDDDKMTRLELSWKKLVLQAQERADELRKTQLQFKTKLIQDIKSFKIDVVQVSSFILQKVNSYRILTGHCITSYSHSFVNALGRTGLWLRDSLRMTHLTD